LRGEGHAGLAQVKAVEEWIVFGLDDAAGVQGLRENLREGGFAGPDGAFDGDETRLFEKIGHR
jgi:hypothetical protein